LFQRLLVQRQPADGERSAARRARLHQERGAAAHNLKRGPGGTLDVETIVRVLQLESIPSHPAVLMTNTQAAIPLLAAAGALSARQAEQLADGYRFLRRVESGLRLLNTSARHDLPADGAQLAQLALLLGHSNPTRLSEQCVHYQASNRALFYDLFPENRTEP
jgi:glutamate-ammonia-ligase adenylyltransferase